MENLAATAAFALTMTLAMEDLAKELQSFAQHQINATKLEFAML
jgi:hypothetical protein